MSSANSHAMKAEQSKKSKIVNVCLAGPYTEGFSYQDNLLPKYMSKLGYKVIVIAPTYRWNSNGCLEHGDETEYVNEHGVRVVTIENDQRRNAAYRFKTYRKLGPLLERFAPNTLFVHGCQFRDINTIVEYAKRHPEMRLFVDNHADCTNSATTFISKYFLHRIIWKWYAKRIEPYTLKFWGVTPARVDFLIENYHLPKEKCDLLVMGADDDEVIRVLSADVRDGVRKRFKVANDDFLIVTGGKIDIYKTQTIDMMRTVRDMSDARIKLLVFGPVVPELKNEVNALIDGSRIMYVPWANTSESYDYFSAADIVAFPGRHSVYWEQAAGMGKPLILKYWPGTTHIDKDENVLFVKDESAESMKEAISNLVSNPQLLETMQDKAAKVAPAFLYSDIARKSVGSEV